MRKICKLLVVLLVLITLTGCSFDFLKEDKYAEEAGTYELYYAGGSISLSNYDYWRIILNADGTCVIESKGSNNSQSYSAEATYEIEDNKIRIFSKNGNATITEEYDYIDGEIQMNNQQISGYTITARFRRATEGSAE